MRVLVVDHTAGVVPFRGKFAAIAAQPGVDLTVLAPRRWVENGRLVRATAGIQDGYRVVTGRVGWPGYENRGFFYTGIRHALASARPEILHLWEEPFSLIALECILAQRILAPRAKVIFSTSDDLSRGFRYPYRPSWFYGKVERFVERQTAAATAVNEMARALLREKGFRREIEWVPHGLDLFRYPDRLAKREPAGDRAPVIGYLGRLIRPKGVDLLLRAVASLAPDSRARDAEVVIVGQGVEEAALRRLAVELGLGGRVRFLPPVAHEEVPSILAGIEILAVPSVTTPGWREHFGRVLIEGMAAGCVLVASDSGAIPEVVGDAGLVFPEGDEAALSRAIARLLADRDLAASLRDRGRRRVEEHFTWDAIARRLVAFYRRVMAL